MNLENNQIETSGAEHFAKVLNKNRVMEFNFSCKFYLSISSKTIIQLDLQRNCSINRNITHLIIQLIKRNQQLLNN